MKGGKRMRLGRMGRALRRAAAGVTAAACAVLFCACVQGTETGGGDAWSPEMERWVQQARLDADETPQQLYEAALKEDTLVVYSTSTRIIEAGSSFEEQYPGLVVEVFDLRSPDIKDLLEENADSDIPLCDVVVCADNDGLFSQKLMPQGVLHKYTPPDIAGKLVHDVPGEALYFLGEGEVAFYNSRWDGQPFTNWWQLTELEFYGRVYIPDPFRSDSAYGFLATIAASPELMAETYEAYYGQPLPEGTHAGEEFIRRFVQNGLMLRTSSDDVMEAVGAPGVTEPLVAIVISSKMRYNDIGYDLTPVEDVAGFDGVFAPNCIMIAGGSGNVSGAKLFIRWVLGEADGTGAGIQPFLQKGAFSVRSDAAGQWDGLIRQENLLGLDRAKVYDNQARFEQLWLEAMAGRTP